MVALFDERECQLKVKGDANLWPTYIRLDNTPILLFMGAHLGVLFFGLCRNPLQFTERTRVHVFVPL